MKAEVKQSRNLKFACAYCIPQKTKRKVEESGIIEVHSFHYVFSAKYPPFSFGRIRTIILTSLTDI